MTDLIFHIGLSKCASTTLQQVVFRNEDGYLGTAPDIALEQNLAVQLKQCTPFEGRQTINRAALADWVERVRRRKDEQWPDARRLIASNEMLSAASRFSDRPILRVLSILKNRLWKEGEVRVVIVLRNQAARLASGYAQESNMNWNPSQQDFEHYVQKSFKNRRLNRLFDYSRWVDGLESILGSENVCVILLEESRTSRFWEKLTDFCALQYFEPGQIQSSNSRKNVRSRGPDSWAIRDPDTGFQAKLLVDKWINLSWPAAFKPELRKQFRQRTIERVDIHYQNTALRKPVINREKEIHLSPRVKQTVRAHCSSHNNQLAAKLGRDLTPLGY